MLLLACLLVGGVSATTIVLNATADIKVSELTDGTFSTMHSDTGDSSSIPTSVQTESLGADAAATYPTYTGLYRTIVFFNSSSNSSLPSGIPIGSTINSATMTFIGSIGKKNLGEGNASLIDSFPTDVNNVYRTDYSKTTFTRQADDILYTGITNTNPATFTLTNLTGIKTGTTNFSYMLALSTDTDNGNLSNWSPALSSFVAFNPVAAWVSNKNPKLTITYTDAIPPVASFTSNTTTSKTGTTVQFNDTSTNTPTYWNWSFGDGSAWVNGTTQNVTHVFAKNGTFTVTLDASNSGGYSVKSTPYYYYSYWYTHPMAVNRSEIPGIMYWGETPWSTARTASKSAGGVNASADYYLGYDFSVDAYPTGTSSYDTRPKAAQYLATRFLMDYDTRYSNKTVDALLAHYNTTGAIQNNDGNSGDLALAYDMILPSLGWANSTLNYENNSKIRDNLAIISDRAYTTDLPSYPVSGEKTGKEYVAMAMLGEILDDYNNASMTSTPNMWAGLGRNGLWVSDPLHSSFTFDPRGNIGAMISNMPFESGADLQGTYRGYYSGAINRYFIVWSHIHGESYFNGYDAARRYATVFIWQQYPLGRTTLFETGRLSIDTNDEVLYDILDAQNSSDLLWSIEHMRNSTYYAYYGGATVPHLQIFLFRPKSSIGLTPPIKDPSYFGKEYNINAFKTGFDYTDDALFLFAYNVTMEATGSQGFNSHATQLSFDFSSHGDTIMPDGGESRSYGTSDPIWRDYGVVGLKHNGILIGNGTIPYNTTSRGDGNVSYRWISKVTNMPGGGAGTNQAYTKNVIHTPTMEYMDASLDNASYLPFADGTDDYVHTAYKFQVPINLSRSVLFPFSDVPYIIDRAMSTSPYEYVYNFKFSSQQFTGNSSKINALLEGGAFVNGTLSINNVIIPWETEPITSPRLIGAATNIVEWNTSNKNGDENSLTLFTAPSTQPVLLKYITRSAYAYADAEPLDYFDSYMNPQVLFVPAPATTGYRVTALISEYSNETPRTPSELTVTGTGSAIKVISASGNSTDTIYTGSGVSTFNSFTTDADTLFVRGIGTCASDYTLINGTYLDYGTAHVYASTGLMDYVSYNRTGDIRTVNTSSIYAVNQNFYGVISAPSYVKVDGVGVGISYDAANDILTVATAGGIHSIEFDGDITAFCGIPLQISNLAGNVTSCTSINWSWTEPVDPNYGAIDAYQNNIFRTTYAKGTTFDNWTSVPEITLITFSAQSHDNSLPPNINTTWVNETVMSGACGVKPNASFTYTPDNGTAMLPVQFTDTSDNVPTQWGWFFQNVTGNNTIVQFNISQNARDIFNNGNYSIRLNATNLYGSNVTPETRWVNVSLLLFPPVANFTSNVTTVCIGDYVQFNDTSVNGTTWFWLFGSGGVDSHLQDPVTNTFDVHGLWDVKLRATNADGFDWENKTGYITVSNCTPPPMASGCLAQTGGIPIWLNRSTSNTIKWEWSSSEILTKIVLDGLILSADIDNSTPIMQQSGFDGSTWHTLKIYNATDYGRLTCLTNASSTISSASTPVNGVIPIAALLVAVLFLCRKKED